MALYPLLYASVGIQLVGAKPSSTITLPGNHIYHTDSLVVSDLYNNGNVYIIRGGTGAFDQSAPTEIYQVTNSAIVLSQTLHSNGSNKVLVGDLLNNGSNTIFDVAFTDSYPNTVLGSFFTPSGNGLFQQTTWLDLQAHGPSIGKFTSNGPTYVVTPAQWPNSEGGLWLSYFSTSQQKVVNTNVSPLDGPSSAIIPATANSSAYIFVGQSQNDGQDAIIPIDLSGSTPVVDNTKAVQYFPGFWTTQKPANMAIALSNPTTQDYLKLHPLVNNDNFNHSTEAQVADLNGDGLPDVLVTNILQDPISFQFAFTIYQQQKNGTFKDVTLNSFTDFQFNESGPYHFFISDINHDGHPDIIFGEVNWNLSGSTSLGSSGIYALANAGLYLNDGAGHFVRAATDQTLFSEFKNSQIAVVPLADGNYDIALFDPNAYNNGPQMTVSLYQGISNFTGPNGINPALKGVPGFNEWYYLNTYADAASAVTAGKYATGLDYYLAIGSARGDTVCAPGTVIYGSSGNDTASFTHGAEVFSYHAPSSQYTITPQSTGSSVFDKNAGAIASDTFHGINRLSFTDTNIALDIGPTQTAGSVYMLYQATFNRTPDAAGLGYWIAQVDKGANIISTVAATFVTSPEFVAKYGANPSNASYVDNLYQNVLHRAGDSGGIAYWNGQLNTGAATKAFVLEQFATLAEGAALVAPTIAHGIAYQQWVG